MTNITKFLTSFSLGLLGSVTSSMAQTAFTYQGKLTDDCCPATGYYDLTFRVFNNAGPGTIGQQGSTVALTGVPVTNGLFTVSLDFGTVPFMGERRWLQIEARTNNPALTPVTLLPRTELTPTPSALFALTAASVTNGAITPAMINRSGASQNQVLTFNGSSVAWANSPASPWSVAAPNIYYNSGNVGIGTGNPQSVLHVKDPGTYSYLTIEKNDPGGEAGIVFSTAGQPKWVTFSDNLHAENFQIQSVLEGDDTPRIRLPYENRNILLGLSGGNVGIGTPNPDPNSVLELSSARHTYLTLDKVDPGYEAGIRIRTGGSWRWWAFADNDTDDFKIVGANETDATPRIQLPFANNDVLLGLSGGNVGIGTQNPQAQLHVYSPDYPTVKIQSHSSAGFSPGRVEFWSDPQGSAGEWRPGFIQSGDRGNFTGELVFYVNGSGFGNRTAAVEALRLSGDSAQVKVLTITGGSDLAEPFQMSEEKIAEGSVVVIDEENPGALKQATRAYDTRVAGIVSGANGVKAGIALHQKGVLEGGQNVALTGRVYAKADASFGAIKPGDLLTTSDTPGHAMKVTDSTKAQGAILGKAMTALNEGTGMVLVLVSLQ